VKKKYYQFNYIQVGDPSRPVIIFLHGFLGNSVDWHQYLAWLSEEYCCLAIDLPGHGQTRVDGDESNYSIPKCADGIIGLLNELEIKKAHLVGYSMGGRLALHLALHHPRRWNKLVLESTSPGLQIDNEKKERWKDDQALAAKLENGEIKDFVNAWYAQPIFTSLHHHPRFIELKKSRWENDRFELARCLRGMSTGKQTSLWNKLAQIQIPVLMLVGEYDPKYKIIANEMKKICSKLQVRVVENCGHMIHFENPHLFAHYVKHFLKAPEQ
jgi:2-succinyl-6-hydroxy-2,4-cyclohexadiene-1-carboxylate synthase